MITFLHFFCVCQKWSWSTTIFQNWEKLSKSGSRFGNFSWQFLFRAGKKSSYPNSCVFGEIRTQTLFLGSPRHFLDWIFQRFIKRCWNSTWFSRFSLVVAQRWYPKTIVGQAHMSGTFNTPRDRNGNDMWNDLNFGILKVWTVWNYLKCNIMF